MTVIRSPCKDEAEYLQALRDDFAAAALPAVIVRYEALTQVDDHAAPVSPSAAVEMAYRYAEAAIIEREKV